jgi:thiamine biosynthesis lipoprotein
MRRTELIMGMPITVAIPDRERQDPLPAAMKFATTDQAASAVFDHFRGVDERFSPYKTGSETCRFDRAELAPDAASPEMREVLRLAEETRQLTDGYFDVWFQGHFDPSGLVKGWAIARAALILEEDGFISFCIEAGGDIEVRGANDEGMPWVIGLRSPFDPEKLTHRLRLQNRGIATSGTSIRGRHIYNPKNGERVQDIASMSVIGPDVFEADRLATAAFAMGTAGIGFVSRLPGVEACSIGWDGMATMTPGFAEYLLT